MRPDEIAARLNLCSEILQLPKRGNVSLTSDFYGAVEIGKNGGRSSFIPVRYDLLPAEVLDLIASVFATGARRHGENNWRDLTPDEIYNHLMNHLVLWKKGDRTEDHLANVACRALMLCWRGKFADSLQDGLTPKLTPSGPENGVIT